MSFEAVVAVLTTVLSVGVKVIGMPDQIKANRKRKSTEGLSWWFMICTLASYAMWVVHGILVHDLSLIIGQSLGVAVTAIIVWQMITYRNKAPRDDRPQIPAKQWHPILIRQVPMKSEVPAKQYIQD